MMEAREHIGRQLVKYIEEGHYDGIINLFAPGALVTSTLYGTSEATQFFKVVLSDTLNTKIFIAYIESFDVKISNSVDLELEYIWTLRDGQTVTLELKAHLYFDSYNKISSMSTFSKVLNIVNPEEV